MLGHGNCHPPLLSSRSESTSAWSAINPPTNQPIHPFFHSSLVHFPYISLFTHPSWLHFYFFPLLLIYYVTFDRVRPGKFFIWHDLGASNLLVPVVYPGEVCCPALLWSAEEMVPFCKCGESKWHCYQLIAGIFPATAHPFIGYVIIAWQLTMNCFLPNSMSGLL